MQKMNLQLALKSKLSSVKPEELSLWAKCT